MFLGVDILLDLVKKNQLVQNLSQRELDNPEGCGFDLRIAQAYTISGNGFLGITDRKTCHVKTVAAYDPHQPSSLTLKPGDFYLVKTIESVNMPKDLVGIFKPRTTLQRMGLILRTAQVAPGYSGELTFALANVGPATVELEMGARIVHLMFAQVKGQTALYRGQWQGGRVTTTKTETQV